MGNRALHLPGHVREGQSNGVLGYHRLPRRRVGRHKHILVGLQSQDGLFLEWVQLKTPLEMGTNQPTQHPRPFDVRKSPYAYRVSHIGDFLIEVFHVFC